MTDVKLTRTVKVPGVFMNNTNGALTDEQIDAIINPSINVDDPTFEEICKRIIDIPLDRYKTPTFEEWKARKQ